MAETIFPDEWLLQSLEGLLTPEGLTQLRSQAESGRSLWETLVSKKVATDAVILEKLSARYRMKIATLAQVDPTIRDRVPEQLARRFRVAPLRMTDSFLEIATSNPFDLDAEQVMKIPRAAGVPLISRIKIMSSLDIADRLRPQDGRARVSVNGQPIDLRVSTLPAALGEKVVIRILDSRATVKSLESLGFNPGETEAITALLQNHEGVILVTGPTGSGKTTSLYSMINQIKTEGVNIVTVEDPVEYRMQGIVQVQVQEKAGLTFGSALRSILRQDPNVILVGEIRDKETAQIAVQASLTGHLVLSTLHTNDAANAVTRLVDIGVEAYKIAASLRGVVAQRLMRKLCPTCKEVWMEAPPERLRRWIPKGTPLYHAAGCPDCAMTGYRGRFSILEILTMTPELERLIAAGEAANKIADAAQRGGMKSLWDSGLAHVARGESTL